MFTKIKNEQVVMLRKWTNQLHRKARSRNAPLCSACAQWDDIIVKWNAVFHRKLKHPLFVIK